MNYLTYPLVLILSLILVGCEKKEPVDHGDLVERDGIWYEKFSKEPYTGEMVDSYEDGQLNKNGFYKDGLKTGHWEIYFKNGKLFRVGSYFEGKRDGYWEHFYNFGQTHIKENYKMGDLDGYRISYKKNGYLNTTSNYLNGSRNGILKYYKNNEIDKNNIFCYQEGKTVDMSFCEGEENNEN